MSTRAETRRRDLVDRLLARPDLGNAHAGDIAHEARRVRRDYLRAGRLLSAWDAHLLARSARRIARGRAA